MVFLFRVTSCRFIWIGDGAMVMMLLEQGQEHQGVGK